MMFKYFLIRHRIIEPKQIISIIFRPCRKGPKGRGGAVRQPENSNFDRYGNGRLGSQLSRSFSGDQGY